MKDVGWLLLGGGWVLGSVRVVSRVGGRERAEGPGGGMMVVVMLEEGGGGIWGGRRDAGVSLVRRFEGRVRGVTLSILYR